MILAVECVFACFLFTFIVVGGVLWKREAFFHEYAPAVQQRFLEKNSDYVVKDKKESTIVLVIVKILMCILFIGILTILIYFSGARSFTEGFINTYIIWTVVNWYDVFALDIGVLAHWKKVRLPGTEDMDKEYVSNNGKHIKDGFHGMLIGIPVAVMCGVLIMVIR